MDADSGISARQSINPIKRLARPTLPHGARRPGIQSRSAVQCREGLRDQTTARGADRQSATEVSSFERHGPGAQPASTNVIMMGPRRGF